MPVSMKSMRMAVSRRSSKVFPEHESSSLLGITFVHHVDGLVGDPRRDIFAIGDAAISPSSSSQRKYCWRHR